MTGTKRLSELGRQTAGIWTQGWMESVCKNGSKILAFCENENE